jgi:tetraacyldisaccharide 4'-kinase
MNFPPLIRALLWPLSLLYGAVVQLRAGLYARGWLKQKRLKGVVVSVGNITVGGTGKTPMVIWLAEKFLAEGKRVAILSRGYRGSGGTSDEIELMKHRLQGRVLFGVGKDRFAEGSRLEACDIDVFILDDGFQHLPLARDVDILLIDTTRPLRQQFLLPAGCLREPVSAVNRADVVVFTRTNHSPGSARTVKQLPRLPIPTFQSATKLIGFDRYGENTAQSFPEKLSGPFYAFCGIGNPEAFFLDLEKWKIPVAGRVAFRDHHPYTAADGVQLAKMAAQAGAKAFVTTEKDARNLGEVKFERTPIYLARIALEISDEEEFLGLIKTKLHAHRGAAA